jgi:hypothetical protein
MAKVFPVKWMERMRLDIMKFGLVMDGDHFINSPIQLHARNT